MRIFKDPKSPFWFLDYVDPRTGRRRRISTKCKTKADAESWARRFLAVLHGEMPEPSPTRWLSQVAAEFCEARQKVLRDIRHYRKSFRLALETMGDVPLSAVNTAWVTSFQAKRLAEASPSNVNRDLAHLSALFSYAVRMGYIGHNPIAGQGLRLPEPPPRERYLTQDDLMRLFQTPTRPYMRLIALTALATGMRLGEILALRKDDLLPTGHVFIRRGKGGRSNKIPLPGSLYEALRAYSATHTGDRLFPVRDVSTAWDAWRRRAGLAHVRFHDLRHSFASWVASETGDLFLVQTVLGHSRPEISRRYAHLIPAYTYRVTGVVEKLFGALFQAVSGEMAEKWQNRSDDFSTLPLQ